MACRFPKAHTSTWMAMLSVMTLLGIRNQTRFMPVRFERDTTTAMQRINSSDVQKRDRIAFGAGRRISPGYNIADRSLAVAIMRLLWAFEVRASPGAKLLLSITDWRGDLPGLPSAKPTVAMIWMNDERIRVVNDAFRAARQAREKVDSMAEQVDD